ncbi:thiamine phosphate synthase [Alicyclobacillus cycloheptanicus]|uniref:Thiamine-phosphate synthase n=1 Tax=Alicyclobacillus cycloheptanicus TaxID=1457 RepID=A0ABT9XK63_9BACL|nr:thiamine phosphate synthase [Alicyclobacillus cycloheptanicus]MDQ0190686.1 thiamine-phosphate pyrophosphorylase [Alicyclobacillus cycloheptanicus]WDM00299.1 thiamine phosphate synthase [Alicyclobacillus cycloheptanicus]
MTVNNGSRASNEPLCTRLGVYVVTDERADLDGLLGVIDRALKGGATAVQLRRKRADGRELVALGREIRRLTEAYHALYLVNDRVDIALLTDADGVHVGQSDLSCRDVRRLVGSKIVGVSAATVQEARQAVLDGADYLGVGAVFPTSSKDDADVCGLDGLRAVVTGLSNIVTGPTDRAAGLSDARPEAAPGRRVPVVAIGGITLDNAPQVLAAGANGLAVVSAVMQADDPAAASQALRKIVHAP